MCWSMLLFCIHESADDDALSAKRRAVRKAEKQREASEAEASDAAAKESGGVLGSNLDALVGQNDLREQLTASFKRLVDMNASWLPKVIQDAKQYASAHTHRSKNAVERALESQHSNRSAGAPQSLASLFGANLWPSLKARGWTAAQIVDGEFGGTTCYVHAGKEVSHLERLIFAVDDLESRLSHFSLRVVVSFATCSPRRGPWNTPRTEEDCRQHPLIRRVYTRLEGQRDSGMSGSKLGDYLRTRTFEFLGHVCAFAVARGQKKAQAGLFSSKGSRDVLFLAGRTLPRQASIRCCRTREHRRQTGKRSFAE